MNELFNNVKIVPVLAPIVVSDDGPTTSLTVDRLNFNSVLFVLQTGVLADAGATWTIVVGESDTDGSFVGAADADLLGTEAGVAWSQANDGICRKIGYVGNKRYLNIVITGSGNGGSAPLSACAILSNPRKLPYSSQ